MKKILIIFSLSLFVLECSFDKKTGIWTGDETISVKINQNENLKPVFLPETNTLKEKELSSNEVIKFDKKVNNFNWEQRYLNDFNYIGNTQFKNLGSYEKLSKISKSNVNKNILLYEENLVFSDIKGNIGVYSLKENRLLFNFNFYKKKLKKVKKNINLIIKNNKIIAADNLGYVYCLDLQEKKIIWAKNYLVPFRSNIKISKNIIFLADEKNKIILLDLNNGEKVDELYTQPAKMVSGFESNLAFDKNNNLLFLSTNGSLYSLNLLENKIVNWFRNINYDSSVSFNSKPITVYNNRILITTEDHISLFTIDGQFVWSMKFKSSVKPIISGNIAYAVSDNNFLVAFSVKDGSILFSKKILPIINEKTDKNFSKKIKKINQILITNGKILLITKNSYFIELQLDKKVNLVSVKKKPFRIQSEIIIANNKMIVVSKKNQIFNIF